jgi:hypothetical protein
MSLQIKWIIKLMNSLNSYRNLSKNLRPWKNNFIVLFPRINRIKSILNIITVEYREINSLIRETKNNTIWQTRAIFIISNKALINSTSAIMQIVASQEERKYLDEGINQIIKTNIIKLYIVSIYFLSVFHYFEFFYKSL